MAAAAAETAEAELEPEEEEQEDESKFGHEFRHVGRSDQAGHFGLVWAEQKPAEEIGGYGRHAQAVGGEAEPCKEKHGQGQLGEGHLGRDPCRRTYVRLGSR